MSKRRHHRREDRYGILVGIAAGALAIAGIWYGVIGAISWLLFG